VPKLNWSAPKDATFMSATNDMFCSSASDVYLLLKSSDFITHDLDHGFDDTVDEGPAPAIRYHLVLRKAFNLNPALEFRCFVRNKALLAVSQREMNYFTFLFELWPSLLNKIQQFLQDSVLPNFPDRSFVFDVYIPPPHDRVWLIDINPWAPRTVLLLFSWLELLQIAGPEGKTSTNGIESDDEYIFDPEFRLVERDDQDAYQFTATKYSAHKLPKEVVDASATAEGGMRELMEGWKRALDKQIEEDADGPD
jgi:D123